MKRRLAQQILVERCIDWDRIRQRLVRLPAIARNFPLQKMQADASKGPYYCNPVAWRLSTWEDQSLLERFDALLQLAERLPNWEKEKAWLNGADFAEFWSLLWQLQVAEYLQDVSTSVSWLGDGPDFEVVTKFGPAYVECLVYRKSFGVEHYLNALVQASTPDARLIRDHCLPFSFPADAARADAISNFLAPLLDPAFMAAKRRDALQSYPIVLSCLEGSSLRLALEGSGGSSYTPGTGATATGDPDAHLAVAFREAARAKHGKNSLDRHRPNLVMVNMLLSVDAQSAINRAMTLSGALFEPELPESIDALAVAVTGIDARFQVDDICLRLPRTLHPSIGQLLRA